MTVQSIDPSKLKLKGKRQSLWFRDENIDLAITFSENEVYLFEFSFDGCHVEGGFSRSFRYGEVSKEEFRNDEELSLLNRAHLINHLDTALLLDEKIEELISFIDQAKELENSMREGISRFLRSRGVDVHGLRVSGSYACFRKIKRSRLSPIKSFVKFLEKRWKELSVIGLFVFSFVRILFFINQDFKVPCMNGEEMACNMLTFKKAVSMSDPESDLVLKQRKTPTQKIKDKCHEGDFSSCYFLRKKKMIENHYGNDESFFNYYCNENFGESCYLLAREKINKGLLFKGLYYYERACDEDFQEGCFERGKLSLYLKKSARNCVRGRGEFCTQAAKIERKLGFIELASFHSMIQCRNGSDSDCSTLIEMESRSPKVEDLDLLLSVQCEKGIVTNCRQFIYRNISDSNFTLGSLEKFTEECLRGQKEKSCLAILSEGKFISKNVSKKGIVLEGVFGRIETRFRQYLKTWCGEENQHPECLKK